MDSVKVVMNTEDLKIMDTNSEVSEDMNLVVIVLMEDTSNMVE